MYAHPSFWLRDTFKYVYHIYRRVSLVTGVNGVGLLAVPGWLPPPLETEWIKNCLPAHISGGRVEGGSGDHDHR